MYSFLRGCACQGQKPSHLAMVRCHGRAALTSQLLRERTVPRFIVAPDGFGKTAAAMEYADVVFGYDHVFWIRCDSPCFLRDLDAGRIALGLKKVDTEAKLVIFEDLPRLDDERRERFSDLLDDLLQADCEVIVTCAPSCDSYSELQHDRLCITSDMLLLSDDELTLEGLKGQGAQGAPSCRTPCMVWSQEGEKLLINGLRREELPADLVVGALLMLMLGQGSFEDLEAILGAQWAARVIECFAESYPYAGINAEERSFYATPIPVKGLASSIGRGFASLMTACPITDRDQLIRRIADTLLAHDQQKRACDVVLAFCSAAGVTAWMTQRGEQLLAQGAFNAIIALHGRLDRRRQEKSAENERFALIAYALLGDGEEALALARRVLLSKTSKEYHRTVAWIATLLLAPEEERAHKRLLAEEFLEASYRMAALDNADGAGARNPRLNDVQLLLEQLVEILKGGDAMKLLAGYDRNRADGPRYKETVHRVLAVITLLERLRGTLTSDDPFDERQADGLYLTPEAAQSLTTLFAETFAAVEAMIRQPSFGVVEAVVVDRWFSLLRLWPDSMKPQIEPWIFDIVNDRMLVVRRQRRSYESVKRHSLTERTIRAQSSATPTDQKSYPALLTRMPVMTVNLFGGFSVTIGERRLGVKDLTRQKSRQLLALLVLHHGREVPKDRLMEMLWPEHDDIAAAKSLYGAWSKLKRAIEVDGVCPYIYRSPSGFRITKDLVDSDVYHFEELCRTMLFSPTLPIDWQETFRRITEEFGDDLLPGEKNNATIESIRRRFRSQLVDSLVSVSHRLEREGEAQGAIWFAREAVDRDPSREDAHMALMRAQISANQRSSALESYFTCRRELAERLGIDPSPALIELYRSIIEEEVDV